MKYGLSECQLSEIINLLSKCPEIEEAVLFGSRAIDTYKEASDVDIALKGENLTASLAAKLKFDLEEDTYLPFFFDFVAYSTITNVALKEHINSKGIVLYRKCDAGMGEWKEYTLKELNCAFLSGFGFKSQDYVNEGIPLIKIGNIQGKRVSIDLSTDYIPDSFINDKIGNSSLQNGDVLIAMTGQGSVGRVGKLLLPKGKKALLNQRVGKFLCDEKNLNRDYLFYILTTDLYQDYLFGAGTGSGQPNLSPDVILETKIPAPPFPEQKAIASVLSSLDDKIDLLHRQNKTLEAMAETLFRQWFVEQADGCEEAALGTVVETTSGGTPSRTNIGFYQNGEIPWVKSKELNGSFIIDTEEKITNEALQKSSAKILPEKSILIAMYGATVGEYGIISKEMACNQAVCALKPNKNYPFTFLYMLVKIKKDELINMAIGSAQQNISQLLIKQLPVPTCFDKIRTFHSTVEFYFAKNQSNIMQIRTLKKLRDTLLPKLMSGEIRVEI